MKFLKSILSIILLFSTGSMSPRTVGAPAARPTTQPQPAPTRITIPPVIQQRQQSVIQPNTYAQALDNIRTQMTSNKVLINNNAFTQEFVNFVKSMNLSDIETKALLEAGANIHATWTDNDETNKQILLSLRTNIQSIAPTKPTLPTPPIVQPRPIEQQKEQLPQRTPVKQILPTTIKNQVPHDLLLGKVKKLEGHVDIYVGAGISATGEPIYFAMEKLDSERTKVWKQYTKVLYMDYYRNATKKLKTLVQNCDKTDYREKQNPYTQNLMEQLCLNKKKFSTLFSEGSGIGTGIVGFDEMLARYSNDKDVIYVAYASSQPITGPFKPKKEINLDSFTLEDFEAAYSDIIICVCVDMMQKLKKPISTEHRGIFKNPFNEIQGTYKNIAMKLHGWAGTVEEQFFNKKYMTVFPTTHAGKLLHSSIKRGGMYLGTDKKPFEYDIYYEKDEEQIKLIKEKFSPIKQELIGDIPTQSRLGGLEDLHVFELNALSKYYTGE